jgi:hypothetical protein
MEKFINLTSRVINTSHIVEIIKKPNNYELHMTNNIIGGFLIFSSGALHTEQNIIKICGTKDIQDYETITNFIKSKKV